MHGHRAEGGGRVIVHGRDALEDERRACGGSRPRDGPHAAGPVWTVEL